jgi:hypothetical protein
MVEKAQIILAFRIAVAITLVALRGNLAVVLDRSEAQRGATDAPVLRERWLLAISCVSALSALLTLLGRLV